MNLRHVPRGKDSCSLQKTSDGRRDGVRMAPSKVSSDKENTFLELLKCNVPVSAAVTGSGTASDGDPVNDGRGGRS